jgi:diadenosine tetraphosphate (Ap4A) HIT family hydrolase
VLVCKDEAHAFSQISPAAFADLSTAVASLEAMLSAFVRYQKINYLMLMMVDPDVHFHVIPRYEGAREHAGMSFPDAGWPAQPNLGAHVALDEAAQAALARDLSALWPVR